MRESGVFEPHEQNQPGQEERERAPSDLLQEEFGREKKRRAADREPNVGVNDENQIAIEPLPIPRQERTPAVIIHPVHQGMARSQDERTQEQPSKIHTPLALANSREGPIAEVEE